MNEPIDRPTPELGQMGPRVFVIVLLAMTGCGANQTNKAGEPAPAAELFPDAPVQACVDVPLVGSEIEFSELGPGELVAIDGTPTAGAEHCVATNSKKACSKRCEAPYVISIAVNRTATAIELAGLSGCQGNECRVDCRPFGAKPATAYRFVGTIESTDATVGPKYQMMVKDFCSLSAP